MLGMKILTADEIEKNGQVTTDRFGISSLELMEHAGRAVSRFVLRELPHCRRILVLCGKGNNGGDGLVAARYLSQAGCVVSVLMLGDPAGVHGDAEVMLERLPLSPISIKEEADLNCDHCRPPLEGAQLLCRCRSGHRFRPPMRDLAIVGRKLLDVYPQTPVVAVDLPSGWDADSREFLRRSLPRRRRGYLYRAQAGSRFRQLLTRGADRSGAHRFAS